MSHWDNSAPPAASPKMELKPRRSGAGGRTRTPDLLITNQSLYQLSYTSISNLKAPFFLTTFSPYLLSLSTFWQYGQQEFRRSWNPSKHEKMFLLPYFADIFQENIWSWRGGSNSQPHDYESSALPTELRQHMPQKGLRRIFEGFYSPPVRDFERILGLPSAVGAGTVDFPFGQFTIVQEVPIPTLLFNDFLFAFDVRIPLIPIVCPWPIHSHLSPLVFEFRSILCGCLEKYQTTIKFF